MFSIYHNRIIITLIIDKYYIYYILSDRKQQMIIKIIINEFSKRQDIYKLMEKS